VNVIEAAGEEAAALAMLKHFERTLAGIPTRLLARRGPAAAELLDAAEEVDADLLALTTHGRSGTSQWLYGSVAQPLLYHATIALLVARPAGEDSKRA
jgi:nucleotide-binding universal stress UspA family protein